MFWSEKVYYIRSLQISCQGGVLPHLFLFENVQKKSEMFSNDPKMSYFVSQIHFYLIGGLNSLVIFWG